MSFTPKTPIELQIRKIVFEKFNEVDTIFTNDSIFEILKEKKGRFKYSPDLPKDQLDAPRIGSLMEILLDTSRMIDEEACIYDHSSSQGAMQADNL